MAKGMGSLQEKTTNKIYAALNPKLDTLNPISSIERSTEIGMCWIHPLFGVVLGLPAASGLRGSVFD